MVMRECVEKGSPPAFRLQHLEDPAEFCNRIGLTYVSCSPFSVPIARLAAAQAAIKAGRKK